MAQLEPSHKEGQRDESDLPGGSGTEDQGCAGSIFPSPSREKRTPGPRVERGRAGRGGEDGERPTCFLRSLMVFCISRTNSRKSLVPATGGRSKAAAEALPSLVPGVPALLGRSKGDSATQPRVCWAGGRGARTGCMGGLEAHPPPNTQGPAGRVHGPGGAWPYLGIFPGPASVAGSSSW